MPLPVLGVAIMQPDIEVLRDWIDRDDRPVEIQDFIAPGALTRDTAPLVDFYRSALKGLRGSRGIHGPFFGLDLANPDEEIRVIVQRRLLSALEICEALGASHMVLHSPFTFWHVLNRHSSPKIEASMFDAIEDCLAPVLARASVVGCTLMLENIDDTDPTARVRLVRRIGHERLQVSVDTGHADLASCNYHAPPVVDFITAAGSDLGHVHIQDVDGRADRHWHPGDGHISWAPVFAALRDLEPQPVPIIEVRDRKAELPDTVARLEALGLAR